ncbi:protein SOX-15-like, partial [Phymastichus coffea]|uniref:protein SOX-15-like n=1 Tax=Phymastichus coffea TaxID=108790 RepID=UPI00273B13B1
MEKDKSVVKLAETDAKKRGEGSAGGAHELYALSFDGKRLLRLQPTTAADNPTKKCQLIGVLTEKHANSPTRHQIRIHSKATIAVERPPLSPENEENSCATVGPIKQRIPRPANAFMLFANEWRKKLATENPRESNKDISVRLGVLWKTMSKDVKEKYFALAREVDAEHKRKYP